MKHTITLTTLFVLSLSSSAIFADDSTTSEKPNLIKAGCPATLDFSFRQLGNAGEVNLCERYKGKVLLIVNTASKCGFTPQFEPLEALYKKYKDQGFAVLGFPSNDFGSQELGSEKEIASFCSLTYGVEFPMFEKTRAAEPAASPFYKKLGELSGEYPQWNFHKYLLDREGKLVASFESHISPTDEKLTDLIEEKL